VTGPTLADEVVTVVVSRRVRAGREAEYERWLLGLQAATRPFPGYLGAQTVRPPGGAGEYVSVMRFASLEALRAWEQSPERSAWLQRFPVSAVEGDPSVRRLQGLEHWFTPDGAPAARKPVRWRMALLVAVVVYLLILTFSPLFARLLPWLPPQARLFASVAVEVALMTYFVMPWLTERLSRWLYPSR
jgi:antibiotic biosynthesis monooxygenase (ABM) superfamily enzyme